MNKPTTTLACWNTVMSTVCEHGLPSSTMSPPRARSRRTARGIGWCLIAVAGVTVALGSACDSTDDEVVSTAPTTAAAVAEALAPSQVSAATVAPPTTAAAVAEALAPSQVSAATVAPPSLPGLCDPGDVGIVGMEGDGDPDQVIELTNEGTRECDVDISATPDAAGDLEPSVRLVPGDVGYVWVVDAGGCDPSLADPQTTMELDVNGERFEVDVEFTASCGVDVVAFFAG